jgi:hypothetical protein
LLKGWQTALPVLCSLYDSCTSRTTLDRDNGRRGAMGRITRTMARGRSKYIWPALIVSWAAYLIATKMVPPRSTYICFERGHDWTWVLQILGLLLDTSLLLSFDGLRDQEAYNGPLRQYGKGQYDSLARIFLVRGLEVIGDQNADQTLGFCCDIIPGRSCCICDHAQESTLVTWTFFSVYMEPAVTGLLLYLHDHFLASSSEPSNACPISRANLIIASTNHACSDYHHSNFRLCICSWTTTCLVGAWSSISCFWSIKLDHIRPLMHWSIHLLQH